MKHSIHSILALTCLTTFTSIFAKPPIQVNTETCHQLKHPKKPFTLVLKKGQDVIPSILQCLKTTKLDSAALMGLGALENPTLAYFNMQTKHYQNKKFAGDYELVALNGNLTNFENDKILHLHVGLGGSDYHMIAGHLLSAKVGATAEITIIPLKGKMQRKLDHETGLNLISSV